MPAVNPLTDLFHSDGAPVIQQATLPSAITLPVIGQLDVNPNTTSQTQVNAAGTSENVAVHVATLVALALIGIYVLRQSGFRFVVAGGIGG